MSHFEQKSIWYVGHVPQRSEREAELTAEEGALRNVYDVVGTARALLPPSYSLPSAFTVRVLAGSGVDGNNRRLSWSQTDVNGGEATAGDLLGVISPASGNKRYVVIAARHTFVDGESKVSSRDGQTYVFTRNSTTSLVVYQMGADVLNADDWTANSTLLTLVNAVKTAGDLPLFICEKRNGSAAYLTTDIHVYDRLSSTQGDLGGEHELVREIMAHLSHGLVLSDGGTVAVSAVATPGQPGGATLAGGEWVALACPSLGSNGAYRKVEWRRYTIPATAITFSATSTRYILRVKVQDDGTLLVYKTTSSVAYPDASQSPTPYSTSTEGSANGAFYPTSRDIPIASVTTGTAGSTPTVTLIKNDLYALMRASAVIGGDPTFDEITCDTLTAGGDIGCDNINVASNVTAQTLEVDSIDGDVEFSGSLTGIDNLTATGDIEGDNLTVNSLVTADGAEFGGNTLALVDSDTTIVSDQALFVIKGTSANGQPNANGERVKIALNAVNSTGAGRLDLQLAKNASTTLKTFFSLRSDDNPHQIAQHGEVAGGVREVALLKSVVTDTASPGAGVGAALLFGHEGNTGTQEILGSLRFIDNNSGSAKADVQLKNSGSDVKTVELFPDMGLTAKNGVWSQFVINISGTSATLDKALNTSGITRSSAGNYTVNFGRNLSDPTNAVAHVTPRGANRFAGAYSILAGSITVTIQDETATEVDPVSLTVTVHGW